MPVLFSRGDMVLLRNPYLAKEHGPGPFEVCAVRKVLTFCNCSAKDASKPKHFHDRSCPIGQTFPVPHPQILELKLPDGTVQMSGVFFERL